MTATGPNSGALFTNSAIDALAHWQRQNMPDRAFVFRRTLTRMPGGVSVESYAFARVDACRLSRSRAAERDTGGIRTESHAWTLARAADAVPFDGTEHIVVLGRVGAVTLRVVAEQGPRTFQTVRKADVSSDGVGRITVGTTRAQGPIALMWSIGMV